MVRVGLMRKQSIHMASRVSPTEFLVSEKHYLKLKEKKGISWRHDSTLLLCLS